MSNPFMDKDNDPNPNEETILKKVSFVKIEDAECRVVGWRYEVEVPGVVLSSNRLFDTFAEALEEFQQSRKSEP